MQTFLLSFIASFFVTVATMRYARTYGGITLDHDLEGAQRFHTAPEPRVVVWGWLQPINVGFMVKLELFAGLMFLGG